MIGGSDIGYGMQIERGRSEKSLDDASGLKHIRRIQDLYKGHDIVPEFACVFESYTKIKTSRMHHDMVDIPSVDGSISGVAERRYQVLAGTLRPDIKERISLDATVSPDNVQLTFVNGTVKLISSKERLPEYFYQPICKAEIGLKLLDSEDPKKSTSMQTDHAIGDNRLLDITIHDLIVYSQSEFGNNTVHYICKDYRLTGAAVSISDEICSISRYLKDRDSVMVH